MKTLVKLPIILFNIFFVVIIIIEIDFGDLLKPNLLKRLVSEFYYFTFPLLLLLLSSLSLGHIILTLRKDNLATSANQQQPPVPVAPTYNTELLDVNMEEQKKTKTPKFTFLKTLWFMNFIWGLTCVLFSIYLFQHEYQTFSLSNKRNILLLAMVTMGGIIMMNSIMFKPNK